MKMLIYILFIPLLCSLQQPGIKLCIGKKYKICGPKEDNPFEKQAKATVIITAIKKGYVQYCWAHEYKNPNRRLFSRSESEFIDQIKMCN